MLQMDFCQRQHPTNWPVMMMREHDEAIVFCLEFGQVPPGAIFVFSMGQPVFSTRDRQTTLGPSCALICSATPWR